jgi:putative endonuclease
VRIFGEDVWAQAHRGFKSRPLRSVRTLISLCEILRSTLQSRLNFHKFITRRHVFYAFMFYYVYILRSQKDKSLYIGYTTDLIKRFKQHNFGESQATKPFRPYKLIFYEAFLNRIDAKNREIYLKSGYGRKTINGLLKKYLSRD